MATKTFEELVDEVNTRGWLVLNCYQMNPTLWRVNLQRRVPAGRGVSNISNFADGTNPTEALRSAIFNLKHMKVPAPGLPPQTLDNSEFTSEKTKDGLSWVMATVLESNIRSLSKAIFEMGAQYGTGGGD